MLGSSGHEPPQLLHAADERVSLALELIEAEQARTRKSLYRRACGRRRDVREGFGHDARKIPLEPCHLCPQGMPRRTLSILNVKIDDWLLRPIGSHTRLLQIAR